MVDHMIWIHEKSQKSLRYEPDIKSRRGREFVTNPG